LIHDYFRVDVSAVWENVRQRLPELKQQISSIIEYVGFGLRRGLQKKLKGAGE